MPIQAFYTPTQVYKGQVTCSLAFGRVKLLQQKVHAFLSGLHPNNMEAKSCTLMLLRFIQEAMD